jgi:hypothetical protein
MFKEFGRLECSTMLVLVAPNKTQFQKLIYMATMMWNNLFSGIVSCKST